MERFFVISTAAAFSTLFYFIFTRMVRNKPMQEFIFANQWLLHPNSICCWRSVMALAAFFLYFYGGFQSTAIYIFTFAAVLDGIDGVVARNCNLISKLGEWLDPMCDKLTYLPPLVGFAYAGILSITMIWVLVAIEIFGQVFARRVLSFFNISGAANNFGKIKAIICFALVIFCALLQENPHVVNLSDEILLACVILASASIVFKFIPNRLYADILSTLNFFCGIASLVYTHQGQFAKAIIIIIVGQLFDLFDGRMAEKHGGTKYGPYLDDIADFVSFGLAPAYVMAKSGGPVAWIFGAAYIVGVAFRLIRFVVIDKKRTDLPEGIFNGLPSPAGALFVLGASLVLPPNLLWAAAIISVGLMVSNIRFAHFGRVIIKRIPKPLFFLSCATIIVLIAFVFKTKSAQMFGYLILSAVTLYMILGRKLLR